MSASNHVEIEILLGNYIQNSYIVFSECKCNLTISISVLKVLESRTIKSRYHQSIFSRRNTQGREIANEFANIGSGAKEEITTLNVQTAFVELKK